MRKYLNPQYQNSLLYHTNKISKLSDKDVVVIENLLTNNRSSKKNNMKWYENRNNLISTLHFAIEELSRSVADFKRNNNNDSFLKYCSPDPIKRDTIYKLFASMALRNLPKNSSKDSLSRRLKAQLLCSFLGPCHSNCKDPFIMREMLVLIRVIHMQGDFEKMDNYILRKKEEIIKEVRSMYNLKAYQGNLIFRTKRTKKPSRKRVAKKTQHDNENKTALIGEKNIPRKASKDNKNETDIEISNFLSEEFSDLFEEKNIASEIRQDNETVATKGIYQKPNKASKEETTLIKEINFPSQDNNKEAQSAGDKNFWEIEKIGRIIYAEAKLNFFSEMEKIYEALRNEALDNTNYKDSCFTEYKEHSVRFLKNVFLFSYSYFLFENTDKIKSSDLYYQLSSYFYEQIEADKKYFKLKNIQSKDARHNSLNKYFMNFIKYSIDRQNIKNWKSLSDSRRKEVSSISKTLSRYAKWIEYKIISEDGDDFEDFIIHIKKTEKSAKKINSKDARRINDNVKKILDYIVQFCSHEKKIYFKDSVTLAFQGEAAKKIHVMLIRFILDKGCGQDLQFSHFVDTIFSINEIVLNELKINESIFGKVKEIGLFLFDGVKFEKKFFEKKGLGKYVDAVENIAKNFQLPEIKQLKKIFFNVIENNASPNLEYIFFPTIELATSSQKFFLPTIEPDRTLHQINEQKKNIFNYIDNLFRSKGNKTKYVEFAVLLHDFSNLLRCCKKTENHINFIEKLKKVKYQNYFLFIFNKITNNHRILETISIVSLLISTNPPAKNLNSVVSKPYMISSKTENQKKFLVISYHLEKNIVNTLQLIIRKGDPGLIINKIKQIIDLQFKYCNSFSFLQKRRIYLGFSICLNLFSKKNIEQKFVDKLINYIELNVEKNKNHSFFLFQKNDFLNRPSSFFRSLASAYFVMSLLISFNISLQEQKNFYQFYTSEEDKKLFDDDEKVYILGKIFGLDLNSLFFRKHEIHSSNLLTKICATRDEPHHESIDKNLINQSQTKIKQLKNPLDFFNKSTDKKLCEEGLSDQNQNATIHII